MDDETLKEYQKIYKFEDKDITWANIKPIKNIPIKDKTYFFVETDGAIYIGTVLNRVGLYYYTIRIEENINNILKNKKGDIIKILINYINPAEKMVMWAIIPNYDSVDNLLDELSTLTVNNKQKIDEFLINKSLEEDEEDNYSSRSIPRNNNRKDQFNIKTIIHNRHTGLRFGGKGRKKTKRNKNKNKKRKTHKKR